MNDRQCGKYIKLYKIHFVYTPLSRLNVYNIKVDDFLGGKYLINKISTDGLK